MLNEEFEYYLENQKKLAKKHENKILVIKGKQVIGVYDSKKEALEETVKDHDLGTFLIQLCSIDPNSTTHTFHSRIRFSSAKPA